jgi:hypothetical protein
MKRGQVDSSVPSPARIWDYDIGGKDNFAVDRAVAKRVIAVLPSAPLVADVRNASAILAGAAQTLDFTEPIAVLMLQLPHFVPDEDDPYEIVRRIMDPLAGGAVPGHLRLQRRREEALMRAASYRWT